MAKGMTQIFRVAAAATVEETRRILIETAKREHGAIMKAAPQPKSFVRTVDGKVNAPETAVKADGRIEYRYHRMNEVVQAAMELLFDLSPVLSGEYRNNHQIFTGGAAVTNLSQWDGKSEIVITNTMPYARKIELGKMKMRVAETDHVYQQAEFLLRRKFGNQARIKFIYRGVVTGAMPDPMSFPSSLRKRGAKGRFEGGGGHAHNKSSNRYPALEIEAR